MNAHKIREIFLRFQQIKPHPTTELKYHNHFELLVAVILSAQATDLSVNKATKKLFSIASIIFITILFNPFPVITSGNESTIFKIETLLNSLTMSFICNFGYKAKINLSIF